MKKYLTLFILIIGCGTSTQKPDALQTVKDFLSWYGANFKEANSFALVNQGEGVFYSVNFEETEKYLTYLKSSGFISDNYLNYFRDYFKKADLAFKKDPINEGPPPGFDYDILLLTQEPDLVIEKGKSPIVLLNEVSAGVAFINIDVGMKLQFSLSNNNGKWKIDFIDNLED